MPDADPRAPTAIMIDGPYAGRGNCLVGPAIIHGNGAWWFFGRPHSCEHIASAIVYALGLQTKLGIDELACGPADARTSAMLPAPAPAPDEDAAAELAKAIDAIRTFCTRTCNTDVDGCQAVDCPLLPYYAGMKPVDPMKPDGPEGGAES